MLHQERMTRATRSVLSHGSSWHSQFADEKTEAPGSKANFPSQEDWGEGGARRRQPASRAAWSGARARVGGRAGRQGRGPGRQQGPLSEPPSLAGSRLPPAAGFGDGSPAGPPSRRTGPGEPSPVRPGSLMRNLLALECTQREKCCSPLPARPSPGSRGWGCGDTGASLGSWLQQQLLGVLSPHILTLSKCCRDHPHPDPLLPKPLSAQQLTHPPGPVSPSQVPPPPQPCGPPMMLLSTCPAPSLSSSPHAAPATGPPLLSNTLGGSGAVLPQDLCMGRALYSTPPIPDLPDRLQVCSDVTSSARLPTPALSLQSPRAALIHPAPCPALTI